LRGRDVEVLSLLRDGLKPSDKQHGTAVAALIAGAPETRTPGLLPDAKVIAVDPFPRGERADNRVDIFDLVRAIDILVSRSPDAINLSLSGPTNLLLEQSVASALKAGIPVIAAVGNEGPRAKPSFPAAYDGVIAVTALDKKLAVYRRAGQGEHVDFAAPGVGVWTATARNGVRRSSGTSFAAPFVTAAAALIKVGEPAIQPDELQRRLTAMTVDLGKKGRDKTYGAGMIRGGSLCKPQ
jgi:subtilisin family serine protease